MKGKFYTKTLASLYAKQGYFDEAEKGYRYLLELEPESPDYLNELVKILKLKKGKGHPDLIPLFSEWVNLLELVKKNG